MADAGGGSSWSALEIILVLVLAVGFLTQLQNGFKTPETPTKSTSTTPIQSAPLPCGLALTRPTSGQLITTGVVLLAGRVYDCEWRPTESVALYATVIDSKGVALSQFTTVTPDTTTGGSATFDTSIPLTQVPTTKKGFLILTPAKNTGEQTLSYQLPLTFK